MEQSEIRELTVVNQQGTSNYRVGCKYNGLLLDKIEDVSVELPDSITIMYHGKTAQGALVFEAINAPIEVRYSAVKQN